MVLNVSIIKLVVDLLGGQTNAAKEIGVTQQAVFKWISGDMPVSANSAKKIEKATGGKFTRRQLRPDIFGDL